MVLKFIQGYIIIHSFLFSLDTCNKNDSKISSYQITYTDQIQELLSGCTISGCHHEGAPSKISSLASYEDVIDYVNSKRIISSLNHESGFEPMPRGHNKWSEEQISIIVQWFKNGAPK